jgi:hypothetical protein
MTQRLDSVDDSVLGSFEQNILIIGHRHRPLVHVKDSKAVLNPGAVGLPVDGEKRARVMLLDLPSLHVRVREIQYEPAPLLRRMRRLHYDERYFNCLETGRWIGFSNAQKRVPILIAGAAIYGEILAELIKKSPDKYLVGYVDDTEALQNRSVAGQPVLGRIADLDQLARDIGVTDVAIAIGDNRGREKVAGIVKSQGLRLAILVHPDASVSESATLSPGVTVDAQAYIGPHCVLEEGVSIWPSVSVSHNTLIKRYASVKPGVVLGGFSHVEEGLKVPLGSHWPSYSKLTTNMLKAREKGGH